MQAIFGKNFKGGIKLRSYCKEHSPNINIEDGQADKVDANGVKEIDMTNLADDRLQEGHEELDFFWKYVDINEVHRNLSEAYARARRLKIEQSLEEVSPKKDSPTPKKGSKKLFDDKSANSPKKTKAKLKDVKPLIILSDIKRESYDLDPLMLDLIYRYWMLLRTSNNGQSLIKFSPSALKEREFEQRKSILKLRIELERVRNLSYMIGKREKLKSSWLKTHQNIIKRTFSLIDDLDPTPHAQPLDESPDHANASANPITSMTVHSGVPNALYQLSNMKKSLHSPQHLEPANNMFDESDQLFNDLIYCDQIYELPSSSTSNNNLNYQERSTLERRRTLSLVRRINRQLKKATGKESSSLNPYARSYTAPKRSESPAISGPQNSSAAKVLRSK